MNISINLTLLIQIINFIIAYFILSKLFLKPALRIFIEDIKNKNNLKSNIIKEKNILNEKELLNKTKLQEYQNYFKNNIPKITKNINLLTIDSSITISNKKIDNVTTIADSIARDLKPIIINPKLT